jgi:hypothetical protein
LAWKPPGTFRDEGARVIITGIGNLDTARKELGKEILSVSSNAGDLRAQAEPAKTVGGRIWSGGHSGVERRVVHACPGGNTMAPCLVIGEQVAARLLSDQYQEAVRDGEYLSSRR